MKFITKSIEELHGADYNPRIISDESFSKLKESLRTFGVCKPVIANSNGILIAGHQRTKAMKEIGRLLSAYGEWGSVIVNELLLHIKKR